jgi:hypothetical protein
MLYIWVCVWPCLFLYICLSLELSSTYERKRGFCVSESGLLHLPWCPPIASIYLQTACHYSLWLSNILLCIYTIISSSIHQLQGTWVLSKGLTIINSARWTSVYRCLYCILSYIPLGRCPGVVSMDHMAGLPLGFCRISMLLSIVVILICIPTTIV